MESYFVSILTIASIYAILALALNLQYGLTGLMNFGIVGFFGIGAYTSGIVTETLGQPMVVGVLAAMVMAGLAGALISLLSLRLSGDFLAIVTLGFAEAMRLSFNNEDWLTRGPRGFLIMTRPVFDGLSREMTPWFILALFATATLLTYLLLARLARGPYGRVLRAIREDALVPATLGKNVLLYRAQVMILGSAIMALAGSFYAHYIQTITPQSFTTPVAILVWMSVIVGGAGNMAGAVVGALVITFIYEGTRFLAPWMSGLDPTQITSLRFIIIGVLLIAVIRFRPEGILPEPAGRMRGSTHEVSPSQAKRGKT